MKATESQSVTRKEMISQISDRVGIPATEAKAILEAWLETVSSETFKNNNAVNFKGFGRFEVYERPAGAGRNPRTGEPALIKARQKLKFIASKTLKLSLEAYQ